MHKCQSVNQESQQAIEKSSLRVSPLSTELDGQISTLSLSRVFYSSDAARTKYLTRYLASFSISTELALSNSVESSAYLSLHCESEHRYIP